MQPINRIILSSLIASTFLFGADYTNSIGMKFKEIPAGSFMMGRDVSFEEGGSDELPQHKVKLPSFYMQSTEVTQAQWVAVMSSNPSSFKGRTYPVENVSWDDAKEFILKLNQKESTNKYRLPTEEEWEYAARAGTTTKWNCGDEKGCLDGVAWYSPNSGNQTHAVASKSPNPWGLYDMNGNVREWTDSCYTEDYNKGCYKNNKVVRGGCWAYDADSSRSADRYYNSPDIRNYFQGFRLLRTK